MKTISLEVNEDVAEKLLAMDSNKRSLFLKFFTDMAEKGNWKDLFIKTAEQAEKRGLKEQELNKLMETLQTVLADRRTLDEIIHDAQDQAAKNGLTQEKLDEILKDLK